MCSDAYYMIHVINGSLYIQYITLMINRWHHPFLTLVLNCKLTTDYMCGDAYHMVHVINGSLYIQCITLMINRWHHLFLTLVL